MRTTAYDVNWQQIWWTSIFGDRTVCRWGGDEFWSIALSIIRHTLFVVVAYRIWWMKSISYNSPYMHRHTYERCDIIRLERHIKRMIMDCFGWMELLQLFNLHITTTTATINTICLSSDNQSEMLCSNRMEISRDMYFHKYILIRAI